MESNTVILYFYPKIMLKAYKKVKMMILIPKDIKKISVQKK